MDIFFFVVINNIIQLLINLITLYDAISSIIYYCSPLIYYIYFSYKANIIQFKISLKAFIFGGLASASYYVYDTFYRLIFFDVPKYSIDAAQYTIKRQNLDPSEISIRASYLYRSYGLLETHTVSSVWIIIAFLGMMFFVKTNKIILRTFIISFTFYTLINYSQFHLYFSFLLLVFIFF